MDCSKNNPGHAVSAAITMHSLNFEVPDSWVRAYHHSASHVFHADELRACMYGLLRPAPRYAHFHSQEVSVYCALCSVLTAQYSQLSLPTRVDENGLAVVLCC